MNRMIKVIALTLSIVSCHASLLVLNDPPRYHQGRLTARFQDRTTTNIIELDLTPDRMSGIRYFLFNQGSLSHNQDPIAEPQLGNDYRAYCQALNAFLTNTYTRVYGRYERYTYRHGDQEYAYERSEDTFIDPTITDTGLDVTHRFDWLDNDDERRSEAFLEYTYQPGDEEEQQETRRLFQQGYTITYSYDDHAQTWYQWTGQRLQKLQRTLLRGSRPSITGITGLERDSRFTNLSVFAPLNDDYVAPIAYHVSNHVSQLNEATVFPVQDRGARLIHSGIYQVLDRRAKKSPFIYRQGNEVQLVRHTIWHVEEPRSGNQYDIHLPERTEHCLDLAEGGLDLFIHGSGLYCLHGDYLYQLTAQLQTHQTGRQWDWDRVNGVNLNGEYTASRLVKDLYSSFLKGRLEIRNLTFANANEINQLVALLAPHLDQEGQLLPTNRQLTQLKLTNTYLPYDRAVTLHGSNPNLTIQGISQEEHDLDGRITTLQNRIREIIVSRSGLISQQQGKIGQRAVIEEHIRGHTHWRDHHSGKVRVKNKQLKKLSKKDPKPKKKIKVKKQQIQHQQSMVQGNIGSINSYNSQLMQVNSEISSLQNQIAQQDSDHRAREQELQTARRDSQDIRARSNYPFVRH